MYSVMIVDKHKQMYSMYRDLIPWQKYQFDIISYCDSEAQAMEHFCEYRMISSSRTSDCAAEMDLIAETSEGMQSRMPCDHLFQ